MVSYAATLKTNSSWHFITMVEPIKRERSRSRERNKKGNEENGEIRDSEYDAEVEMMERTMGFRDFETSKLKDHTESAVEGVFKYSKMKRKYRQYLNRRGGYNKKLDKM